MRFSWRAVYALFFLYRCGYSVLGQLVVLRLTLIPDTTGYQALTFDRINSILAAGDAIETSTFLLEKNATLITQIVAAFFWFVTGGSAILINIGFQSIAFVGLVYFLRDLDPRIRLFVLLLAMTPSFSVWSSIASKEAIVVFLVAVVARYVVDIYNNRDRFGILQLVAVLVLYMFKPHFLPAIIFVAGTSKLARYVKEPATFALLAGTASLAVLYAMRDTVDVFSRLVARWIFAEPGQTQRAVSLIAEKYDVFTNAPEGMYRAFVGPTLSEASNGVLQMASLLESLFILAVLAVFITWNLLRVRPETLCRITEFSEHESNGRELDEGERVAVEVLPVLGQSAAAVEPGDGAFDHPTPGLDDEALHPIGSLDDLGLEVGQDAGQGAVKDRPLIGAVGEQFPEKGKQTEQGRQQRETTVAILNVGGGDDAVQQQALRIDQNMPLLALDQLAGIEAVAVDASPPFSALFTL